MDWKTYAALALFVGAIVLALVIALYASVTKYAKQFDPAGRPTDEVPREPGDGGP